MPKSTRKRRRGSDRDPGNVMFGTIGWLFADLMLALALTFIVATTVGQPLPAATLPPTVMPALPPTTTTSPTKVNEPALELEPVKVELSINAQLLLYADPGTTDALRQQIQADPRLAGRRAGLVLIFGGTSNGKAVARGLDIAGKFSGVLSGLGAAGFVFRDTVYRPFISMTPPESLSLDIYLFKL